MSYREFTFDDVLDKLGLTLVEDQPLHAGVQAVQPSPRLREWLDESVPLATAINTEKARSELILMPILFEVRRLLGGKCGLFSGRELSVDTPRGLNGVCDYLFSLSAEQFSIRAPILVVVEAKNLDLIAGIPQCLAELCAVQLMNERAGTPLPKVHGVVSTGTAWRFLSLSGTTAQIDPSELALSELPLILGILCHVLQEGKRELRARSGERPGTLPA